MLLVRVIYLLFNLYGLGLVIYTVLVFFPGRWTREVRARIAPVYVPTLNVIRTTVKPVNLRGSVIDLAPALLLFGVFVVREIVVRLLVVPI